MSGNGNNYNRTENTNSNNGNGNVDNNFHLRNPYSPPAKTSQQQQKQQQLNHSGNNDNQGSGSNLRRPFNPYLQKTQQHQQRQQTSNQHSTSHSSFAIKPGGPLENDQQQQQRQNMNGPVHQNQRLIENEGNALSRHAGQPEVTQDQRPSQQPQQQQQPPPPPQQQQQQQQQITANMLEEQLEVNFELEASVMALEAELKHTRETLKKQADSDRSKMEHQLRLAQQEMKRWKLRATQQEKGRSIVGEVALPSSPSTSAFSNRLMGNAEGLRPSSPTKRSKEGMGSAKPIPEEKISGRKPSLSQERRHRDLPVARLARSLLEQVKPSGTEKGDKDIADDMSIRQVLFSIASMGNEDINTARSPPTIWTEGKLVEWLIATFSSKSCDRYWSALLLKSPEARKYVRENVCLNWDSGNEVRQKQQRHSTLDPQESSRRRRRRNRIRALPSAIDSEKQQKRLDELQAQARQSLRQTWWNPNDIGYTNGMGTSSNSSTPQKSSSLFFRKWATSLAASRNLRHLHILRVLLAEEAGGKDMTISVNGQESGPWWDLCYPSIAVTIQRIVYTKLIRSKKERKKRQIENRSPRNPPYGLPTKERNRRPRYRIGMFEDLMKKFQDEEGKTATEKGVAAMEIKPKNKAKSSTRGVQDVCYADLGTEDADEEVENQLLAHALCVWMGLLQVASSEQLEACYKDRKGIVIGKNKRQSNDSSQESLENTPPGGLFIVSLILDLLEELQFGGWMKTDDSTNFLSPSRLLSAGGGNSNKGPPNVLSEDEANASTKASSSILPQWYDAVIAVLTQVGKTPGGMEILGLRVLDDNPKKSDFMGSALDVSIRQLHTLAMHLDDARTRDGSILRFKGSAGGDCYQNDLLWCGDPVVVVLLRSVEAWVRLWHQVLLFVQSTNNIYFRNLVLDLEDWFTSAYATLLASEEIRQEIKAMIRWQLRELRMDEQEYQSEQQ